MSINGLGIDGSPFTCTICKKETDYIEFTSVKDHHYKDGTYIYQRVNMCSIECFKKHKLLISSVKEYFSESSKNKKEKL